MGAAYELVVTSDELKIFKTKWLSVRSAVGSIVSAKSK